MNRSLQLLRQYISLIPIPLLVLSAGTFFLFSGLFMYLYSSVQPAAESETDQSDMSLDITSSIKRRYRIRLHLFGPGRAKNWAAQQIRQFHFVQELKYSNDSSSITPSSFTEQRQLNRHRFLLVSAPAEQSFSLDWGVTNILQTLGSSDDLLPVGKKGYPIGPIEPETLTDQEQSRLMNFIRGDRSTAGNHNHVIRFISPHEGTRFTFHHSFSGRSRSTSLAEEDDRISGMERDVLVNAPVIPERYIPERYREMEEATPGDERSTQPFSITGIDQYLQSFFPCRLTGSATLKLTGRRQNQLVFTGSGSFNIIHPSQPTQIGELRLSTIKFIYERMDDRIGKGQFKGRIAVSSFPNRHVLNRIKFLREPSFRISYQASERNKNE